MSGTRERILAAAKKLSSKAPLHRLAFSHIAEEAGVSPQTVGRYFPDRKALSDALGISSENAGDDTRTRILFAAEQTFGKLGYHAATLDDVARAAGLTKGAIYWNFESKADVFLALLDHQFSRGWEDLRKLQQRLDPGMPAVPYVKELFIGALHQLDADPLWPRLYIEFVSQTRDVQVRRRLAPYYRSTVKQITEILRSLQSAGRIHSRMNAEDLAITMVCILDGTMIAKLADPDSYDPAETARRLVELVSL